MNKYSLWFILVSFVLIFFGIFYAFFGMEMLPVSKQVLLHWESSIYGAIMIGWGVTLLLVGRIAFQRKDRALLKALLYGLTAWLVVEAIFSAYLGVWPNVGVDVAVLGLFSVPLIMSLKKNPNNR